MNIEVNVVTIGVILLVFILSYCAHLLKEIINILNQMSENMRILTTMDHRLNVIEVKLEKLRS